MTYAAAAGALLLFALVAAPIELWQLKLRDAAGLSSMRSLQRLQRLCADRRDNVCVEKSLAAQAKKNPLRYAAYADHLMARHKYKEVIRALTKYVTSPKADIHSQLRYAIALGELGQIDRASKYFERVLQAQRAPVEHAQIYVKYLSRARRFDQALGVILHLRRTKTNALPSEYRLISAMRNAVNDRVIAGKK